MLTKRAFLAAAASSATGIAAALFAHPVNRADAQAYFPRLVGAWTFRRKTSDGQTIVANAIFSSDGAMIDVSSDTSVDVGIGCWEQREPNQYLSTYCRQEYDETGVFSWVRTIWASMSVDATGDVLTIETEYERRDLAGNLIERRTSGGTGTRVIPGPYPG